MSSQIACAYTVTAAGGVTATALQARMAAVGLDNGLLALYGLTVSSDSTVAVGNTVTRTIALGLSPDFKRLFPDGTDQVSPLANFMTGVLEQSVLTPVVATAPVVS